MLPSVERPAHVSLEQWQRALRDFATYQRQLPRLLQEGHAGRIVIIKDEQVIGIRDTLADALQEADDRFGAEPVATFKINPLDVERLTAMNQDVLTGKEATCPS